MCCGEGSKGKKCQCKKYCFTECVTITDATVNQNGDLIITLSDGTVYNAGNVQGYRPVIFSKGEWTNPIPTVLADYNFSVLASMLPKVGDYLLIKMRFQIQQFPSFTGALFLDADGTSGQQGLLISTLDSNGNYEVEVMLKRTDFFSGGHLSSPYGFLRATVWREGSSNVLSYGADSVSLPIQLSLRMQVNTGSAIAKIQDYTITKFLQP